MKPSPGLIAGIIVVGGVAALVAVELPEIRRYLSIRSM
jgi:hypothetical protein